MLKMQMIGKILVSAAVLATVRFLFSSQLGFLPGITRHQFKESVINPSGPFAYYKLSLQWIPSACSDPNKQCIDEHKYKQEFTIRGLWPQRDGDMWVSPYETDRTCLADGIDPVLPGRLEAEIYDLKPRLKNHWPSLFAYPTSDKLWSLDWKEHGMCSHYAKAPKSYFEAAMELHNGFNNLQSDILFPFGKSFTAGQILENAKNAYGFYPQIVCNTVDNQAQLLEIRFCYDTIIPSRKLQDCPCRLSGCKHHTYIILPRASTSTVRNDMERYERSEL